MYEKKGNGAVAQAAGGKKKSHAPTPNNVHFYLLCKSSFVIRFVLSKHRQFGKILMGHSMFGFAA